MAPFVYRVTPYDPAEQDRSSGHDRTRIPYDVAEHFAAAYIAAVGGFALDAGIDHVRIDNPMATGFHSFSVRWGRGGHGLRGLFPQDLAGYHDGALVPLATGLGLVRAMVLRDGAWCRLVGDDGFFVHVGCQDDVYLGSDRPLPDTESRCRALGLFVERVAGSPYDPATDEVADERPADDSFWRDLADLVTARGGVLLEVRPIGNAYRWHRVTSEPDIEAARERLPPRSRLAAWPDLTDDAASIRSAIARRGCLHFLVRQYPGGGMYPEAIAEPGMARADVADPQVSDGPDHRATLVPIEAADRRPLLAGVLPDADGVLRARWRANRTRADQRRSYLASLRVGDVVTGVVTSGLCDVGVYVDLNDDLGRGLGFLRTPEMSWCGFDSVDDVAPIGRPIRAAILHVDWAWEQVSLSLRAVRPDPWQLYANAHHVGESIDGVVTTLLPFGVLVRLQEYPEGGVEGLVRRTEPVDRDIESPEEVVAVGDRVRVTILDIDRESRRIFLSLERG
ncbi:S1 RNA-binding domain-containing protein [Streptomyces sp. SID3343]|uniref:S1 RNA-binding domain-containing protein n=1 Tax=Streptomyces sp. SID3343 TaxID=2690260 RepID=UPI00136B2B42|nr:S1 RNA-binding domain-containing protein [Streptomyces sp. SID3343]MYW00992.1 S1 RNA-binding domain-containing protein [Streptomyces sp. SID3343]